jgi:hypothetical protein
MPDVAGLELFFESGMALYKPASANMVSRSSTFLFIGGGLLTRFSARAEVYAQKRLWEREMQE